MATSVVVDVAARSDRGLVRERNEDAVLVGDLDAGALLAAEGAHRVEGARGPLLAVLDGMGGVGHGDLASRLAGEVLWAELAALPATAERPVFARHLRRAVRAANRRLIEAGETDPALRGMGTTASAAALCGDVAVLAQVGDSRAYLLRSDRLTQITRDQSVVSALVSAGVLSETQARTSMQRSLILQALGGDQDVEVALSVAELCRGDLLLLCSDGLHGVVDDARIATELAAAGDVEAAADALVALAHEAGAPDNVSVVVAAFSGEHLRAPRGDDDQPRFTELDPREEGERALTQTSRVARRLAHRAGLRPDSSDDALPATGPHAVVRVGAEAAPRPRRAPAGPASAALAARRRVGPVVWIAALLIAALSAYAAWDLL